MCKAGDKAFAGGGGGIDGLAEDSGIVVCCDNFCEIKIRLHLIEVRNINFYIIIKKQNIASVCFALDCV